MRIIAGQRRGHKIDGPRASADTRPTSDMVRESLFNIVRELVVDRLVIDLFAGTGALGLEALSRGAERAIFVEKDRENVSLIIRNIATLRYEDRAQVKLTDAYRWVRSFQPPADRPVAVFLDPPYREYQVNAAPPEPVDRSPCRSFAGRLGDRARSGADSRRDASCPISRAGISAATATRGSRSRSWPASGRADGDSAASAVPLDPASRKRPSSLRKTGMSDRSPCRDFALEIVKRLRQAGYQALWAGGCVRDLMLGQTPADYDVATAATPEQVMAALPYRAITVGISFGVVRVRHPRRDGVEVEVATFRSDGAYVDGRRPESVVFGSPELDAARRDFTINGMFMDPLSGEVIDFVGGQADLKNHILRAIGDPVARLREDRLRSLRAIRLAARFQLQIEPADPGGPAGHGRSRSTASPPSELPRSCGGCWFIRAGRKP